MRKCFLVLMVLMLLSLPVLAEEEAIPAVEAKVIPNHDSIMELIRPSEDRNKSVLSTGDVVVFHEDGSLDVTVKDITMSIIPPFGSVVLTQDVMAQVDTYLRLTDNLAGMAYELKKMGVHALMIDPVSGTQAMFCMEEDTLSKMLVNASGISEKRREAVSIVLKNACGADYVETKELGENVFFKIGTDLNKSMVIYTTYVGGKSIDVYCYAGEAGFADYDIEMLEWMLTDTVFAAK